MSKHIYLQVNPLVFCIYLSLLAAGCAMGADDHTGGRKLRKNNGSSICKKKDRLLTIIELDTATGKSKGEYKANNVKKQSPNQLTPKPVSTNSLIKKLFEKKIEKVALRNGIRIEKTNFLKSKSQACIEIEKKFPIKAKLLIQLFKNTCECIQAMQNLGVRNESIAHVDLRALENEIAEMDKFTQGKESDIIEQMKRELETIRSMQQSWKDNIAKIRQAFHYSSNTQEKERVGQEAFNKSTSTQHKKLEEPTPHTMDRHELDPLLDDLTMIFEKETDLTKVENKLKSLLKKYGPVTRPPKQ